MCEQLVCCIYRKFTYFVGFTRILPSCCKITPNQGNCSTVGNTTRVGSAAGGGIDVLFLDTFDDM